MTNITTELTKEQKDKLIKIVTEVLKIGEQLSPVTRNWLPGAINLTTELLAMVNEMNGVSNVVEHLSKTKQGTVSLNNTRQHEMRLLWYIGEHGPWEGKFIVELIGPGMLENNKFVDRVFEQIDRIERESE